ncbi:hypothetical protein [Hymenobacter negativus]|uniref:DUF3313 domain-containing protein n=1 Tax=Hymenobacter negativus TaxID=2795026 RepID=A0ABS0QCU4_9BACT|nr:hypothetical protein [Hymenobacter negativus]MBH8560512.1 hypothetical protein [Hymenobacter negativus]
MNRRFTHLLATGWLAFTTGCAGSYSLIRPKSINTYTPSASTGPVALDYQFDALRLTHRNKKYVKKENKMGYRVVAVRVTNNWDREVNFTRDLNLLYGERPVGIVPSAIAAHDLRQGVAIYLLYVLLNVQVGGTTDPRTGNTVGGTFLPTGPFIAGGNMLVASGGNTNLRKEFAAYDLTNRIIKPGETVYGILSLRETAVAPLRLEPRAGTVQPGLPAPAPAGAMPGTAPR